MPVRESNEWYTHCQEVEMIGIVTCSFQVQSIAHSQRNNLKKNMLSQMCTKKDTCAVGSNSCSPKSWRTFPLCARSQIRTCWRKHFLPVECRCDEDRVSFFASCFSIFASSLFKISLVYFSSEERTPSARKQSLKIRRRKTGPMAPLSLLVISFLWCTSSFWWFYEQEFDTFYHETAKCFATAVW